MYSALASIPFLEPLVLLAAAVIFVPLFKRLGLGAVLGYLVAGVGIGPFGLGVFFDAKEVLHIAELGVVLLLFLIGLDLHPERLWSMRRDIFGLGTLQVVVSTAIIAIALRFGGLEPPTAVVVAGGLSLSSTAFAMQILQDQGQVSLPFGRRAFAILLLQDLAIVPLLTLVTLLSPVRHSASLWSQTLEVGAIALAVLVVVLIGRFLLNPIFSILARANAREIMTAAGLLVVLGAAAIVQAAGLSMAMGAFLAGVLLSESRFRLSIEADLDPFRGLLLGLFFMGVGMSINITLVLQSWWLVMVLVLVVMGVKGAVLYGASRLFGSPNRDALRIAAVLPQGGEFGFVLFAQAVSMGVMGERTSNIFSAVIILTMALTPFVKLGFDALVRRYRKRGVSVEIAESFEDARARVLLIGYGRFGQIVATMLRGEGMEITALDRSAERIRQAARFGAKVYYGDATRLDVLRAAGAEEARMIALCMQDKETMTKAIRLIKQEFPKAAIFCRAMDRLHAVELIREGVDFQIREVFESGVSFARAALGELGIPQERVREIEERYRANDLERLAVQVTEGIDGILPPLPTAPTEQLEKTT